MGLEVFNFLDSLVITNPVGATDPKSQGDDHLRGIKITLTNSFPGITGAMTLTQTQLNDAAIKAEANAFLAANSFDGDITLLGGNSLIIQDTTNADSLTIVHNGTDIFLTAVGAAALDIIGLTAAFRIRDGASLVIFDASDTDSLTLRHDGTDIISTAVGANNWDIIGLGNALRIRDGAGLVILDTTDADSMSFNHDGVDAVFGFVGTLDVEFGRDAAPSGDYRFNTSDTDIILFLTLGGVDSGRLSQAAGGMELRSLVDGGNVTLLATNAGSSLLTVFIGDADGACQLFFQGSQRLLTQNIATTGVTSGAGVDDVLGVTQDIGFNVLPIFNTDTSDVLEANHCGKRNELTGANNRTLTLAADSDLGFPVDGVTHVEVDTGTYTIAEGASTTLFVRVPGTGLVDSTGGCTVEAGGFATIIRRSNVSYEIFGSEIVFTP